MVVIKNGRESLISYRYADRFTVARAQEMKVSAGDRLQLKLNEKSVEGTPLNNGEIVTVHRVKKNGAVVVQDRDGVRKTLASIQRVFVRGYAVTSYGSQGKTVDTVIFADATSSEQWYVTISRGRKRVVVFIQDKEALRANVVRFGARELAVDLSPTEKSADVTRWAESVRLARAAIEIRAAQSHDGARALRCSLNRYQAMNSLQQSIERRRAAEPEMVSCVEMGARPALAFSKWQVETWLLQWAHLESACLKVSDGDEQLTLSFPRYRVVISRGKFGTRLG